MSRKTRGSTAAGLLADIFLLAMLVLLFVCVVFISGDTANLAQNIVMLCAAFMLMILSYFTSLTAGLVLNVIAIFGLLTYMIYQSFTKGTAVPSYIYFWTVVSPLLTVCISMFSSRTLALEQRSENLSRQIQNYVTIDALTGMKNLRAFENEAYVYMNLSRRYQHDLLLLVIELRHQNEMERMLGGANMQRLIKSISKAVERSLRTEDMAYLLDADKLLWGALLLSSPSGGEVVVQRVRKSVQEMDVSAIPGAQQMSIELRIGFQAYDPQQATTAFGFLEQSRKQLEYDV